MRKDAAALWQTAVSAYRNADPGRAERAVRPLLSHPQAGAETFLLGGLVYGQLKQTEKSIRLLEKATRLAPENADGWLALGNALGAAGDLDRAAAAFAEACELAPENADAWNNRAVACEDMGRFRDALDYYNEALRFDPDHHNALRSRAAVMGRLRWFDKACDAYDDLLRRHGNEASLMVDYAEFLEQANRPQRAAELLEKVGPGNDGKTDARAQSVRARLLIRENRFEAALSCLRQAAEKTGEDFLGYKEGVVLDRLGRWDEAMAAFTRANRARARQKNFRRVAAQPLTEYLEHKIKKGIPAGGPDHDHRAIVFLTGLPRSGTTLLDRMLDAHPEVQVLEELEGLRMTETAMAEGRTAAQARMIYWDFIGRHTRVGETKLIVDKNPLHVMHLDMVPEIFPAAKVLLALRHPFDAALSCFMQDFDAGPVTARFHELQSTAKLCAQFLTLMHGYETARPETTMRVHYESLVADFRQEITRVLEFLGLEWHGDIEDYARIAADANPIMTASYEQVTRKLYQSAVGRWKNYAHRIKPFHSILGGHLDKFGYDA